MLDDEHRIAFVHERSKRADELVCVARMKANRGLIEHIEKAREARPKLRRKTHALRLTARERVRTAIQAEVANTNTLEEGQALLALGERHPRDGLRTSRELNARDLATRIVRMSVSLRSSSVTERASGERREPEQASQVTLVSFALPFASTTMTPAPSHEAHCPCFVLNEKKRGSSSG
jgi:hypothetical protein